MYCITKLMSFRPRIFSTVGLSESAPIQKVAPGDIAPIILVELSWLLCEFHFAQHHTLELNKCYSPRKSRTSLTLVTSCPREPAPRRSCRLPPGRIPSQRSGRR
jgi:hypothetical protein